MSHQRKVIRDAVVSALLGETSAGQSVYPTRVLPYRTTDLPAIAVYADKETSAAEDSAPRELTRTLEVKIEALVSLTEDPDKGIYTDDAIDDLSEEIETAMHADPYFRDDNGDAQAADSVLSETAIEVIEDGELMLGFLQLTYQFTYRTVDVVEPGDADDFLRVDAKHRPPEVGEDEQAEDLFEVR